MLRQHFATMTQTVLLMWLRHAGGCVELGLVTVHSAPSRVVTVTLPNSKTGHAPHSSFCGCGCDAGFVHIYRARYKNELLMQRVAHMLHICRHMN